MNALTRADLLSLEQYAEVRSQMRAEVMAHKCHRRVPVGAHVTLYFEDRFTIRYQIQEMLRVERIFEGAEIQGELDAYNPLIPDGDNWKATFMIEYPDVEERRRALALMVGIENRVWVEAQGQGRVYAIADEDLERTTADKTSSVHFLRFQLPPPFVRAVLAGVRVVVGIDHPAYPQQVELAEAVRDSLASDLRMP